MIAVQKPAEPLPYRRFKRLKKVADACSAVDKIIGLVNADLASAHFRKTRICDARFWTSNHPAPKMTPEEVLELDTRFRAAGWPDIQVVFWQDSIGVLLSERPGQFSNAPSAYNGKPLAQVVKARQRLAA